MQITPIKTRKITTHDTDILQILDEHLPTLEENSIIAISSKIVAICEGRIEPLSTTDKDELVKREADHYLPRSSSKYDVMLTITQGRLAAAAGIDESNANGYYILWPQDPWKSANKIREYLSQKYGRKNIGVLITDSHTAPLRWGTVGVALAHSGFAALKDYVGEKDLFGRLFEFSKANIAEGLAAAAVVVMGEGTEQTPIAVISDVPFVEFRNRAPTHEEIESLKINRSDDLYAPLLTSVKWHKK